MGGVVLAKDVEVDVLDVLADVEEVGELVLTDEFLYWIFELKVISQPDAKERRFE